MAKVEKQYVKECDCPEIQKGWSPKEGDKYYHKYLEKNKYVSCEDLIWLEELLIRRKVLINIIFLPSLKQLMVMIGERFISVGRQECVFVKNIAGPRKSSSGPTPELACLKAYKEIKKEKNV